MKISSQHLFWNIFILKLKIFLIYFCLMEFYFSITIMMLPFVLKFKISKYHFVVDFFILKIRYIINHWNTRSGQFHLLSEKLNEINCCYGCMQIAMKIHEWNKSELILTLWLKMHIFVGLVFETKCFTF